MNHCSYCRGEIPNDHTNMEGQPWCGVCTWWIVEIRRLRFRVGLLASPVTAWRLRADPSNHPWTKDDCFVSVESTYAAKFSETGRIGLGVDVPSPFVLVGGAS